MFEQILPYLLPVATMLIGIFISHALHLRVQKTVEMSNARERETLQRRVDDAQRERDVLRAELRRAQEELQEAQRRSEEWLQETNSH